MVVSKSVDNTKNTFTAVAGAGSPGSASNNLASPFETFADLGFYRLVAASSNHRIVRSGPSGFRWIVGCVNGSGSVANQLCSPQTMSFDTDRNLWVANVNNSRAPKMHYEQWLPLKASSEHSRTARAKALLRFFLSKHEQLTLIKQSAVLRVILQCICCLGWTCEHFMQMIPLR